MGKGSKPGRPMKGFSKVVFGDDGLGNSVACTVCKKLACFCTKDLAPAVSPALSSLSVSIKAEKSPTFSFQPYSGYGNTLPDDAVPFALDPPSSEAHGGATPTGFFDGGSPTWLFYGCIFSLSATGVNQAELKKVIERHGGTVSPMVHKRVGYLVATELAVKRSTQRVRKANAKDIPIVTPNFVHDSISAGELCDFTKYAPQPLPRVPTKATDTDKQQPRVVQEAQQVPDKAMGMRAEPTDQIPDRRFRWRRVIRKQLKEAGSLGLRRRQLREAAVAQYLGHLEAQQDLRQLEWSRTHPKVLQQTFRRKLRRARSASLLVTEGKMVRLAD